MSKCNINLSLPLSDINCCDSQSRRCTRAQDITRRCSVICFVIVFGAFINFYCNYHCFCCNPCFAVHLLVGSCWFLVIVLLCHVFGWQWRGPRVCPFPRQDVLWARSRQCHLVGSSLLLFGLLGSAQASTSWEARIVLCRPFSGPVRSVHAKHFQAMPMYRHFKLKSQFFFGKAKQELIRPCLLSESISLRLD